MKMFFALIVVIGLGLLVFSVMVHREFHAVATESATPVEADMPLTKLIGPELFAPAAAGEIPDPNRIAQDIVGRIYMTGALGILVALAGLIGMISSGGKNPPDELS